MKKILVIASNMEIGGAERALIGLLNAFDYNKYGIDLFLLHHKGAFLNQIPQEVNLLPEIKEYTHLGIPMIDVLKSRDYAVAWGRIKGKIKSKVYGIMHKVKKIGAIEILNSFRYTRKFLPMISEKEYELVIGFTIPHYIATEKAIGKKKVVWIHTDYSCEELDDSEELQAWGKNDVIVSISEAVTQAFLKKFPALVERVRLIENIADDNLIKYQSQETDISNEMPNENSIKLLTVGRFCFPKRQDEIPKICKLIISQGIDIKWYLIGYGEIENEIKESIKKNGVEGHIIILGKKDNPYPYIKACDIYVQPSRYEGKCVAVREAQILNKPVVITRYSTSESQLNDGIDGVIVPMDNEGCAAGIAAVIRDKDLQQRLIENTKKADYTNAGEIVKLYQLMGD